MIFVICYTNVYKYTSIYDGSEKFVEGIIYKIKKSDSKIVLYIKADENLVVNYYTDNDIDISLGDRVIVDGELSIPSNNSVPNLFNYKKYLYYNKIFYIMNASKITKLENNTNIIYYLKEKISLRIDKIYKANEYIKIFILGDTSYLDEDIIDSYQKNGISHLFSISGMHISLFASVILYILKRISYNNYYNYSMVIIFLAIYTFLVGSSVSVVRSLVMYILFSLNKLFNLEVKKIDIMLLVLVIMLLLNPFYLYNISFQYSYLISFSLVLFSYKLKYIKSNIIKSLYISFMSFLISFPICIYNFYQVNVLSIFLNLIVIPLVNTFVFPLSLVSFLIPKVSYILSIFVNILQGISMFFYKLDFGIINFSKPNIFLIIVYYICIYMFLYNKKIILIFILMIIHKNYCYFGSSLEVLFLDVSQGDSTFIKFPYNKGNILIDTGGIVNSDYSIVINKTIPYLKSIGVNKIDYLILTHGDYDHMGEGINLVENFKVEKIIFNCNDLNDLEHNLIEIIDNKNILYYSCIKELNIDNNKLYFLNSMDYNNENDNSNVIYFNYNNYKFLFMGDAGINREIDILNKYNLGKIDILKVGHHGSRTSSSEEFIEKINPKYSVISVGKKNRYGHPNDSILDNLRNSMIYRTDRDGSIMFKVKNGKLQIDTCAP